MIQDSFTLAKLSKKSALVAFAVFLSSCSIPQVPGSEEGGSGSSGNYLYVAAGLCNGGGNTTYTAATSSNLVYRVNLETGNRDLVLADFNTAGGSNFLGDTPVGVIDGPNESVYVLVENATSGAVRRIVSIEKKLNGQRIVSSSLPGTLGTVLRSMSPAAGGYFFSRTAALERVSFSNGIRVPATGTSNPYVNAPAGSCSTSTSIVESLSLNNGAIVYLNNAASQNRFGIISSSGYVAAADCKSAQAAPIIATSNPTAAVYDRVNNKLIVAYSGNSTAFNLNAIYVYSINEATFAISSPQKIYDANSWPGTFPYLLYGISDMVLDEANMQLYISTAVTTATTVAGYKIMKLNYNPARLVIDNNNVLSVPAGLSSSDPVFYPSGLDTRCISQMFIGK